MSEPIKSAYPVQTRIISPINEGAIYSAKTYIQFKINASELPMWLVNDSYLRFDIEYTRAPYTINAAKNAGDIGINKTYIRNAANIFDLIKVKYGGDDIYTQTFNIEQNTLKMLSYGESYLNANFATYTTNKMIKDGKAYLEFDNGFATDNTSSEVEAVSKKIMNVMIPVNQLLPMFQDVNSVGFPIGKLKRQLEINLYIAEPYRYLVDYDDVTEDFTPYFRRSKSSDGSQQDVCDVPISSRYPSSSIQLNNVRLYCQTYVPTNEEDAIISNSVNGSGLKYKYNLWHIGVREIDGIKSTNNPTFSVTTENTKAFMLYCHESNISPSLMHRPFIQTLYLRFGEMQLPFQPISGDTWTTPFEYKFTVDDVLNNIDTYYSETNNDYNRSYLFKNKPETLDIDTDGSIKNSFFEENTTPGSSFLMMGANFTNSNDKLGSPSSRWNHQYQASFNSLYPQKQKLRLILGVNTEYGMIVKNGDLAVINL